MLKTSYKTASEIPEGYDALYTIDENSGEATLTGIDGMKTAADVEKVQAALTHEKTNHKETKAKLAAWDGLEVEEVRSQLDSIPDLQSQIDASGGGKTQEEIEAIVQTRVEAKMKPFERKMAELQGQNDELSKTNTDLTGTLTQRDLHAAARKVTDAQKIRPEAVDDVLLHVERNFSRESADSDFLNSDGLGLEDWLGDMVSKRPHWVGDTDGAGGKPGDGRTGSTGENFYTKANWNLTKQGQLEASDPGAAARMRSAAGVAEGAIEPVK